MMWNGYMQKLDAEIPTGMGGKICQDLVKTHINRLVTKKETNEL